LRSKFKHTREEERRDWRKLHNDELHFLYYSPDTGIVTEAEMATVCRTHGNDEKFIPKYQKT
jgi:hypothetical protein